MSKNQWTFIFFYGSVFLTILIFIKIIDKKRLKELIPIGLFIAAENYTVEILGLHLGYWRYPLESPGYPEVTIISSIIFFPLIAMIFAQYITNDFFKDLRLVIFFTSLNMIIEIVTLKTTSLFVYERGLNLFVALLMYLSAYILIILFKGFYGNLKKYNY